MTASKIEWTGRSDWNPIRGCTRVTEACTNCYAEIMAARFSDPGMWGHTFAKRVTVRGKTDHRWTGKVALQEDRLTLPLRWRKPGRVFVNSTSDLLHEKMPDAAIDRLFAVMALCPHLTFQILTKRPQRAWAYTTRPRRFDKICTAALSFGGAPALVGRAGYPFPNIWIGTSVHDQTSANEFIPELLGATAAIRFISYEPALGPIDLARYLVPAMHIRPGNKPMNLKGRVAVSALGRAVAKQMGGAFLDWVICGGESGHDARPMHPDWARAVRDQCAAAGVPYFFKQWGEWTPGENVERDCGVVKTAKWFNDRWELGTENLAAEGQHCDDQPDLYRVGKKAAGRHLDGKTHSEFPQCLTP